MPVNCNDYLVWDYERRDWTSGSWSDYQLCVSIQEVKASVQTGDEWTKTQLRAEMDIKDAGVLSTLRNELTQFATSVYALFSQMQTWVNNLLQNERNDRNAGDSAVAGFAQSLHNQQSQEIASGDAQSRQYTDANVHALTVAFSNQLSDNIQPLSQGIADNRSSIQRIHDQLKSFIDDPIGWILTVFQAVLITFIMDETATLIAPDTEVLPPRADYVSEIRSALHW